MLCLVLSLILEQPPTDAELPQRIQADPNTPTSEPICICGF